MRKAALSVKADNRTRGLEWLWLAARPAVWATVFASFVFASADSSTAAQASGSEKGRLHYNHDIRPILSDNCFFCHGPDKNKRKAKLRLDVREVEDEKKSIVYGKSDVCISVIRI